MKEAAGNNDDAEYDRYLARVRERFNINAVGAVFRTNTDPAELWERYLTSFPDAERQHHNCNACRHFIQRFGGLVVIDADGNTKPAVWDGADAYGPYVLGVERMAVLVKRAKVTGLFVHSEPVLGHPKTGVWRHLHAHFANVHRDTRQESHQLAAEKAQAFQMLRRGLEEFDRDVVEQAVQLLESGALHRGEMVLGAAKWLLQVHKARTGKTGNQLANVTWAAVASAPTGFCNVKGTMLGTLLEDIVAKLSISDIKRRFAAKMDEYMRPTAAPKAGQIQAAEAAVQALGIAPAFARRYAVESDLRGILWTPSAPTAVKPSGEPAAAGVFDHLKPAKEAAPELDIPPKKMTWEKFARDVLPGAAVIEYRVPMVGPFCALTAAQDPAAPPILQWDDAGPAEDPLGQRNTVSWSFPSPPASAAEWNLQPGALAPVRMIVKSPNAWGYGMHFARHGMGAFLLLDGARDTRGQAGGGLFPEHLRSELQPYRATIEAHMNRMLVAGADDPASVGFGIGLMNSAEFSETAAPKAMSVGATVAGGAAPERIHVILVLDDSGSMQSHLSAARQALASMLSGIQALPGKVDVTIVRFGTVATMLAQRILVHEAQEFRNCLSGRSGGTALNDTLHNTIRSAMESEDSHRPDVAFFLGVVTDGRDEGSRSFNYLGVRQMVLAAQSTGRWTIAFAGARAHGYDPAAYANSIGIPEGNVKVFDANEAGFADMGASYASSTAVMSQSYASGLRASTSFFSAAPSRKTLGKDHPVLLVTSKSGTRMAYELDRWE